MGKKNRKNRAKEAAGSPATAPAVDVSAGAATTVAPRSTSAPSAKAAEKSLMETLDDDTSPARVLGVIVMMSGIPIVICLLVKYAIVPMLFPHW